MSRARLSTIFAIVFVDLLGFSLILPLVPFYAKEFQASDTVIGLLVASYAAAQLIGAPILGRISDRYGRRPVLLISIFGTAIGFLLLGVANTLTMLFASRILDGLTGGNISVAQAYITDITNEEDRARGLGLIGAAFGLGFIIGPAVGGLLSSIGANLGGQSSTAIIWQFALPAFTAMTIAFLNLIAVYFFLPESLTEEQRVELTKSDTTGFSFQALLAAFSRPRVGPLLLIRLFFSLAFATFQTIFPLYALNRFELGAEQTAYILTYVGFLVAFVQGFAVGRLTKVFHENWLIFSAILLMSLSLLAWALTPTVTILLIVLAPLALAGGVLNTVLNSLLTKVVLPEEVGGTLGLSASLESLSRVVSPTAGGLLLDMLGPWAPGLFGAIITAMLCLYAWRSLLEDRQSPILNQV